MPPGSEPAPGPVAPAPPPAPGAPVPAWPGPSTDDGHFHRLHPLTPLVYAVRALGLLVIPLLLNSDSGGKQDPLWIHLLQFGVLALVLAGGGFVSWLVTRYRIEGGVLRVDSGLLSRKSKRLRLDRLQSVDVLTPLAARAVGLVELRVTTAGSEHSSVRLRYLPADHAHRLRAELLGLAAGLGPGAREAYELPLVAVPPGMLVATVCLDLVSWRGVLIALSAASLSVTAATGHPGATGAFAGTVVAAVLVAGNDLARRLNALWNFQLAESPDGLRIRSGLLSTRAQTVPPGRIQALRVRQPLLWRLFGWATVHMNEAGYVGSRQAQSRVLAPVLPVGVAMALCERVLGGVHIASVPLTRPPRRAALCSPVWWRAMAAGSDDRIFVSRHGVFSRDLDIVPNERTQSVRLVMGPWQRLVGLATVHLDSTRGPVRIRAAHRDAAEARRIVDEQAGRARRARRSAVPARWMQPNPAG